MAGPSYYVQTPDGKKVPFDVPEGADAEQVRTLAARALKQAAPDTKYQRPILSDDTERALIPPQARGELKVDDSASTKLDNLVYGALTGLGVGERYATHLGNRVTSALRDITPVGDTLNAAEAGEAWRSGNYLTAIGKGALAGIGLIPGLGDAAVGGAKAMFLGVMAKNADKQALKRAEEMAASGLDRKQIWNETGWFQGADNKWRFEVPDNEMAVDQGFIRRLPDDRMAPFGNAIQHDALAEAYPMNTRTLLVGKVKDDPLTKGSFEEKMGKVRLQSWLTTQDARSTVGHELQHFVQGQEGFARGGMTGTINSMAMREVEQTNKRLGEIARAMDDPDFKTNKRFMDALRQEYDDLMAHKLNNLVPRAQVDPYEGYRRLAGEVEARNVQTRLDMTPGQRKEYAPWETEDVPREDQFVIWGGDQPQGALGPLYHGSDKEFDRFSNDFIGSGEGAQGYGYGHYLTESERLASSYRNPRFEQGVRGPLYEVMVDANPEQFVDLDKPVAELPDQVQRLAKSIDIESLPAGSRRRKLLERLVSETEQADYQMTGQQLHNILTDYGADVEANRRFSEALAEGGFRGIRYGQPRDALGGGGLNYVVFDPELIDIRNRR